MRKILIIAEKPSAARAIADALGGFRRQKDYFESDRYFLSWAIGHLVQLCDPEDYDPAYKKWSLQQLPILPSFSLKANPKTKKQLEVLRELVGRSDGLINACDAAREGELIFRYIIKYLKATHLPVQRLWTASLTKAAIRKAFQQLKPAEAYDSLYYAAECRSRGDWLVGINASRGYTCKFGDLLSIGRVQTPTLALIVKRQEEIESFVPSPFWEVTAEFASPSGTYTGKWQKNGVSRFTSEADAWAVVQKVNGKPGEVLSRTSTRKREKPPLLFDLTSLQRLANRKFGWTAEFTLKTAQSLYERKVISYPRTDCNFLTSDLVHQLPAVLDALARQEKYRQLVQQVDRTLLTPANRRVVRNDLVTDHHAIIPTEEAHRLSGASDSEKRLFDLIVRRFLCHYYSHAEFEETELVTVVAGETFYTKSSVCVSPGWKAVEPSPPAREEENSLLPLPPVEKGQAVTCTSAAPKKGTTTPPKPYTEDSLLAAMEHAGKSIDDEEMKQALKDRGLGTPATRAAIIERLKQVGYIEGRQKNLYPTEKGRTLIRLLEQHGPQLLLSAEMTAEWEKRITDIQKGAYEPRQFMEQIKRLTETIVEQVRQSPEEKLTKTVTSVGACPVCGHDVLPFFKGWRCSQVKEKRCSFVIWSPLAGKKLTEKQVSVLLKKKETIPLKGFRSKQGKPFTARLVIADGKVELRF